MPLSDRQLHIIAALQYFGAGLSLTFCSVGIVSLWRRIFSGRAVRPSRYLDKLVLVLLIFDFLDAMVFLLVPSSIRVPELCKPVAFMQSVLQTAVMQWVFLIGIYSLLSLRRQVDKMERYLGTAIVVALCVGFSVATWLLSKNFLGVSVVMCWIPQKHKKYQFYVFYFPLMFVWIFMIYASTSVYKAVSRAPTLRAGEVRDPASSILRLRKQAIILACCCVLSWLLPMVSRAYAIFGAVTPTWIIFGHGFSLTLLGFIDALIYDQTRNVFTRFLFKTRNRLRRSNFRFSYVTTTAEKRPDVVIAAAEIPGREKMKIFSTTFNTGSVGTELLDELDAWIPSGGLYDIYAIGVQECLIPDQLCKAIHFFLGPSHYTYFTESIGSGTTSLGFHGFIQLMVFVRTPLVTAKSCLRINSIPRQVAKGRDLILTKAPNKGAVAISLFLLDTTICFICCHLSADSHKKSGLSRRIRESRDILGEVGHLETGFDAHLVHDHCVVLGDMNFRLTQTESYQVLDLICDAAKFEENLERRATWMEERYEGLIARQSFCTAQPKLCTEPVGNSDDLDPSRPNYPPNHYFGSLLEKDELTQLRNRGAIFSNFKEMDIRFPPTYRLKKRPPLSTAEALESSIAPPLDPLTGTMRLWHRHSLEFTNRHETEDVYTIDVWNSKLMTSTRRIPSYTDRVLYFSSSDKAAMLIPERYEACPTLTLSDHLPVSFSFVLQVKAPCQSQVPRSPFFGTVEQVEVMHLEISFSIADIDCYILRARTDDLTNKGSTASTYSESSSYSDLRRNISAEDWKDQPVLLTEEGDEIPVKPPTIPRKFGTGSTVSLEGSRATGGSSMGKESRSSDILPIIHSINALVFMANESVLTAIEENKLSRIASSLTISHPDYEESSTRFSKVLWRHAKKNGVRLTSTVTGKTLLHNIHVLIRLTDASGRDIGQGVLMITPHGKLIGTCPDQNRGEESAKKEEDSSSTKVEESPVPPKASIMLTSGGFSTGFFDCRIMDFKIRRGFPRTSSSSRSSTDRADEFPVAEKEEKRSEMMSIME